MNAGRLLDCSSIQWTSTDALVAYRTEIYECHVYPPFSRIIADVVWIRAMLDVLGSDAGRNPSSRDALVLYDRRFLESGL